MVRDAVSWPRQLQLRAEPENLQLQELSWTFWSSFLLQYVLSTVLKKVEKSNVKSTVMYPLEADMQVVTKLKRFFLPVKER